MNEGVPRHPGAETMAALLDGTLAPRELAETTAHLRDCADCRTILGETARFERESGEQEILPVPETRQTGLSVPHQTGLSVFHSWRLRLVAAAVAAIALLVPVTRYVQYRTSPIGMLIAAAPGDQRPTLARVSDYPWARPPAGNRGPGESPAQLELKGVAGKVLRRTEKLDTVKARHGAGVAHLLIDQTSTQSVDLLARAAERSNDARVWNDLAAARYTVGEARSNAVYWDALAAADKAIALDPKLAEAYFNRALILEQLGSAPEAARAWERYLELDPSSEWAIEARARLRKLEKKRADFEKELERAKSDPSRIAELVREFPQEARAHGETPLLGKWARAELAGDGTAVAKLAVVRAIGEQLRATSGESLLGDVVATIDRASGPRRAALATAHGLFYDGRLAFRDRDDEKGESLLRDAETALRAAGSPLAEAAAHYRANAMFARNRAAEAIAVQSGVLSRIDSRRYRALDAQVRWQLALAAIVRADWDTALREGTLATTTFEQLRESDNAAFTAAFAAHALERMGASEEALPLWRQALSANPRRRADALYSSAVALAATERPDEAEAVMRIIDDVGDQRPGFVTEVLMDRARVAAQLGDPRAADRHLRTARASAVSMAPDHRAAATAGIDVVQASLSADPRAALATLDRAIGFYTQRGMGLHLPGAYLQRGRAYRAAGNPDAALADYEAALREVEKQRPNLGTNASPAFLDTAAQLIDETIELHLDRGAGARAFVVADRAHSLLADAEPAPVPEGTALIEYVLLPKRVAIFCRTSTGLTAVTVSVPRRELADLASDFVEVIRRDGSTVEEVRAQAAVLDRILIAPVGKLLTNVDELVLVRDRQLQAVPFAALFDGERWLVERFEAIRYAPSAARTPKPAGTSLAPAVVIADPDAPGWDPLPYSVEEANEVGAIHRAPVIEGADATRARFLDSLQRSGLVHYAGHADSNARAHGALVLAPSGGDDGLLTANDIARLSLHERSPLVVLSACGTFRGEVRHVAGMPTLARAFLTAGARAVVGTQWEVGDDVTTPLFITFHQELREGQAPARALRTAQIAMLQTSDDPRHRHPAAWSAVGVLSNL